MMMMMGGVKVVVMMMGRWDVLGRAAATNRAWRWMRSVGRFGGW